MILIGWFAVYLAALGVIGYAVIALNNRSLRLHAERRQRERDAERARRQRERNSS